MTSYWAEQNSSHSARSQLFWKWHVEESFGSGTIPSTNIDVKKQAVPKTDLTQPLSSQTIEKAPVRTKSPVPIQKKKPSSYSGSSNGNSPKPEKTQSPSLGQPIVAFPLETRIILHGLVKTPNVNGMTGIIRSGLSDGRQRVYIDGTAQAAAIKHDNLKLDDAPFQPTSKLEHNSQKLLKKSILEQAEEYVAADVLLFSACQDSKRPVGLGRISKFGFRNSRRGSTVTTGAGDGGAYTAVMLKNLWDYAPAHSRAVRPFASFPKALVERNEL